MVRDLVVAALAALTLAAVSCSDTASPTGDGGDGGKGGSGEAPAVLPAPSGAAVGDELVVTVSAASVGGHWDDAAAPGAVVRFTAGANLPRDAVLVGGFAQSTKVSLGAWDGGEIVWSVVIGEATFDAMVVTVDPSAAGLPVLALMSEVFANDTPIAMFRNGDELQYVMTSEDGGTGLLPTLLLARWGRPHDIEGLYDMADQTYQGPDHATLAFDGTFEGTHPRLRIATSNGLVAPEDPASSATYHVSPVPLDFSSEGIQRERVLDDLPWLAATGWLEMQREGKIAAAGGVDDGLLGAAAAYVFVDYRFDGELKAAFEVMVDGQWFNNRGVYIDNTRMLDARVSGTGRTAIELPQGKTLADVTAIRVVPDQGAGSLEEARLLSYDGVSFELIEGGQTMAAVAVDAAAGPVELTLR